MLKTEIGRLRRLGELICSDETKNKLKTIAISTVDKKLEHEKEVLKQKRKYEKNFNPLLCQMVPVKTASEMNRTVPGDVQIDCVEHCGSSASGEYANTLATICVFSGWWEGEGVMGKGQERALMAMENASSRYPFRKVIGYLRYDAPEELEIINDLYRNELRLYKNFFQPVIKLAAKTRIKGKIHRKYDQAKTPYQRLMESNHVSEEKKQELKEIYESLNPAELKRTIDRKLNLLYKTYQKKKGLPVETSPIANKKLTPSLVSFYPYSTKAVSVS